MFRESSSRCFVVDGFTGRCTKPKVHLTGKDLDTTGESIAVPKDASVSLTALCDNNNDNKITEKDDKLSPGARIGKVDANKENVELTLESIQAPLVVLILVVLEPVVQNRRRTGAPGAGGPGAGGPGADGAGAGTPEGTPGNADAPPVKEGNSE